MKINPLRTSINSVVLLIVQSGYVLRYTQQRASSPWETISAGATISKNTVRTLVLLGLVADSFSSCLICILIGYSVDQRCGFLRDDVRRERPPFSLELPADVNSLTAARQMVSYTAF